MNVKGHFLTITKHKIEVAKNCFRSGLYWQGITHDLSKYMPSEFLRGVKYYQGDRSPNDAERRIKGVSRAWLHHKGRNRHHMEYWIDYDIKNGTNMAGMKMPARYLVEMVCDRIAACKIYLGDKYTDSAPLDYYNKSVGHYMIHEKTSKQLKYLLSMLAQKGEDYTFNYIKNEIVKKQCRKEMLKAYADAGDEVVKLIKGFVKRGKQDVNIRF